MNIPESIVAGDSASWYDGPCSPLRQRFDSTTYALSYELRGPAVLTLAGTVQDDGWAFALAPAISASLPPGRYLWAAIATAPGQRVTLAQGMLIVKPDPAALAAGHDPRSQAQRALDDAEAALATFSKSGGRVKGYSIGTRSMQFDSASEILAIIDYWRRQVEQERSGGKGFGGRTLRVRFAR